MEEFSQLLTCAVCLDRYRNPKLLPCQHSFCLECTEGLVDYVRRQIKCPECRAEHRVAYQGVSSLPTNVTLQRFLELHIDITGELPDPYSNQVMERCQICSEKAYCANCAHCDKKICGDCKDAHVDVLKREIQRITNQVKRVQNRLEDTMATVNKHTMQLQNNSISVIDEIDDIYRRLSKALKDRAEHLKHEVERYLSNELKQLSTFRQNLDQEVANIQSNIELAEKYMVNDSGTTVCWQDNELMDTKDVFLRTMEFIRNFEYEPGDYARRIKFSTNADPNKLAMDLGTFADVHTPPVSQPQNFLNNPNNQSGFGSQQLSPGQGSALMRSKSDHRLTTQFRNMQEDDDACCGGGYGSGRKFGEPRHPKAYGQEEDGCGGDRKSRFRSRFARHLESSFEEEPQGGRGVRFEGQPQKERERVLDTDDVSKGPMSGITRLSDSPRVIEKIAENERPKKIPASQPAPPQAPIVVQKMTTTTTTPAGNNTTPWRTTSRQLSEDDEVAKQKKANKELEKSATGTRRQTSNEPKSPGHAEPEHHSELPSAQPAGDTSQSTRVRKLSAERFQPKKRSSESEESGSTVSSDSNSVGGTEDVKSKFLNKTDATATARKDSSGSVSSTNAGGRPSAGAKFLNRYMSNPKTPEKKVEPAKEEDEDEDSSEEEESEEDSSDEESDSSPPAPPVKKSVEPVKPSKMEKTDIGPLLARSANARDKERETSASSSNAGSSSYSSRRRAEEPASPTTSSVSSYRRNRATSPPARDTEREPASSRYGTSSTSASGTASSTSGVGSSRYPSSYTSSTSDYTPLSRSRTGTSLYSTPSTEEPASSRYSSGLASKYLNKSRHTFDADDHPSPSSSSSRYGSSSSTTASPSVSRAPISSRSSYLSKNTASSNGLDNDNDKASRLKNLRDRRAKVSRSKSSHDVLLTALDRDDDDDEDRPYVYHRRKSITATPVEVPTTDESSSLSSWARYLRSKYGKDPKNDTDRQQPVKSQRSPVEELPRFNFSTNPYMNKRKMLFKFGSRGSDSGFFTWPRGIACGPDGQIAVADSSNHRYCKPGRKERTQDKSPSGNQKVFIAGEDWIQLIYGHDSRVFLHRIQIFNQDGTFIKEFGQYGNSDGEFDCCTGIAINRIGQFICTDRYNHRVQVFDPSGRFLRAFGSQGTTDGKMNLPWGVATDILGFIFLVDKENHRVQVFQSDGSYVGKFGTFGTKDDQLNNPHFVAVSNTNKVYITDTNNHRISVWDVNGRFLKTIGEEGSGDGQFKLPRGLVVDESGSLVVGDSGNNRIVILSPDGAYLRSFGCYGSGDGEFKGLEGVAVTSSGNILICDRENHRVQIY